MQLDNNIIDRITQNLLGVAEMAGQTREEAIRKVREVVREGIEHFDLVTRDEFDVAQRMLGNARMQLDAMEKRVSQLEAALKEQVGDEE
ncbi:accessory factor UbiK family protein [Magnetofaba australis]|uniref:Accessory factor UbiK family protein n=1 Tax=Magnetofaba australis IT-1 TaxID=1434232 RepID=A0A1Y2K458_9PROT|nr:accessory factor UbiK family protein [Magnetofaba australis]OSM02426.1 hypothetical protein MAIT1_02570 [Magnetofaba australis IT-1]